MKKQALSILICILLVFCGFTLGFFLGRNKNHEVIHLSTVSTQSKHNTAFPVHTESTATEEAVSYPVNINTADLQGLSSLPGIGETLAQRILDFRSSHGYFSKPEELMNVDGIGAGKLEAILDYITTGG